MLKKCLRYALYITKIYTKYIWNIPEIYGRYIWDASEICLRYARDLLKVCLWYTWEQRSARILMESQYQHLLPSLVWSRSRHPFNFAVTMSLGFDIPEISQPRWVSISTSKKFSSLDESRSRHPRNFSVSMSQGLNVQEISQFRSRHPTYPSLDESQFPRPQIIKVLFSH